MQRISMALQRLRSVAEAVRTQPAALMSLTQLGASDWPAALQQHSGRCWHHMPPSQAFSGSSHVQGLQDFFDAPRKEKEEVTAGKEWKAKDLRQKSWDDLHKLWYVLLKERNMLLSERMRKAAKGERMELPQRFTKVRKSMARIKLVLTERALAHPDPAVTVAMKQMING